MTAASWSRSSAWLATASSASLRYAAIATASARCRCSRKYQPTIKAMAAQIGTKMASRTPIAV